MYSYVIGVDGGNSKTHYALFDSKGNLVNFLKAGTASHEQLPGGFEDMKHELKMHIGILLKESSLGIRDVGYGIFGLAGADIPKQYMEIEKRINEIGLKNFKVYNDAFLGIKAGSEKGYGICSINGTGTSCVGIDRHGRRIQIGGLGEFSGDFAGGGFISGIVMRLVYESIYKGGPQTLIKGMLFDLLDITCEEAYVEAVYEKVITGRIDRVALSRTAFLAANKGDETAVELLKSVGKETARSVVGAFRRLDFSSEEEIDVVMAGSIYVKGENSTLVDTFKNEVSDKLGCKARFHMLQQPPVAGAVLWALEELNGGLNIGIRKKVLQKLADI